MLLIDLAKPKSEVYEEVSAFARKVYQEKFGATIMAQPNVFAYAIYETRVVGCLGLYSSSGSDPLLIERYIPGVFGKISNLENVSPNLCAELGTRIVVDIPGFNTGDVSIALAAFLIIYAKAQGIHYLGFTSNRTVSKVVRELGIDLISIGEPDLTSFDLGFRENWKRFFEIRQLCYGMRINSNKACFGCFAALSKLEPRGIEARVSKLFKS